LAKLPCTNFFFYFNFFILVNCNIGGSALVLVTGAADREMSIGANLLMFNTANLFLFMGASRLMFSVVTMGISISSRAGFAFAHLLGDIMAVLFRYTVTFFFGLCFTSLDGYFGAFYFWLLCWNFFNNSFDNYFWLLTDLFWHFFFKSIRNCDIDLLANLFMDSRTFLDCLIMTLRLRFVNRLIGFPGIMGFRCMVRTGYRAIAVIVTVRMTLPSLMMSIAYGSANFFMLIFADLFGNIFTFGLLFLFFSSFLDGFVDSFAGTSGFFRVGRWGRVSVSGAAMTVPPGFGGTYGNKSS